MCETEKTVRFYRHTGASMNSHIPGVDIYEQMVENIFSFCGCSTEHV